MQLKTQAKLIADPDGGSKGAGLHLSQASRDQACNENLPTIKERFTLYICSTFRNGLSRPKVQRLASGLYGVGTFGC